MTSRDPLQELEAALSFQTSADFCTRVRQQVGAGPAVSPAFGAKWLTAAAAAVLAVGAGLVATYVGLDVEIAPVGRPIIVGGRAPAAESRSEGGVVAAAPVFARPRVAAATATGNVASFETLVPDDQRRALDHLLAAMRQGRANVPPAVADHELNDSGQYAPRALVIEPMKLELLAGTPGEPIKDPVKEPIK